MLVTQEIRMITPAEAEAMLEKNTLNRKLSSRNVAKFAKMMTDGGWIFDAAPITFNGTGDLLNGQHRLFALIESGTTQQFLVVRGVENAAMEVMDTGKSRTFADVLKMHDQNINDIVALAAAINLIYRYENGARGTQLLSAGQSFIPYKVLLDFYLENREKILASMRQGRARAKSTGSSASAMSLASWLFNEIDGEDAEFFFDRLLDGAGLESGDPILALRNHFLKARVTRPKPGIDMVLAFTFKAWNIYRDGGKVQVLTWRRGGSNPEPFPTPR